LKSVLENAINVGIFFGGPLLGVFMAGMLFRGFSANGAFFGSIVGVLAVSWTALSPKVSQACGLSLPAWLELTAGIHSFWYGAIGFAVTWLAGSVISAFGRPVPEERIKGLVMGALISKREA
jgi:Na+/proline symporter